MLTHLPRLLAIWTVIARYRLDTLLPPPPGLRGTMLLLLLRLHPAWWLAGSRAHHPARLREAFEELGPLFIKLGQLLATRRDLLPANILDELVKLQDQVPPFPSRIAMAIVEAELRAPLSEKFSRFDEKPLAAASIAQVHTAALPDGREVVVKILRPGVAAQIRQDMALLRDLTAWLEARIPQLAQFHPHRIARDYEQTLLDETDLIREAANTRQMRQNFLNSDMLYVPEVHDAWCTTNIMVAERIYGVPIDDQASFARLNISRQQLAEKGFAIFFRQLLDHNFFHADMHPGNVFVETTNPTNPRYIALDIAIVGQLSREDQLTVARLALALFSRDYSEIIRVAHRAGWLPPGANLNQLTSEVARIIAPILEKPIDQIQFGPTLLAILDMAREHHLEIPVQLVLLIKTLVHVEGLGRSLYPALDIWTLGKPLLTRWLKERVGPAALMKRLGEQAPAILTGMPDMPDLILDALTQMRQSGQWQDRQLREIGSLRQELRTARRQDFIALAGIAAGMAMVAQLSGSNAVIGAFITGIFILWRITR
ncbi:MAG: 2-octaprenylphenol hydroxylase [Moraxellaceae bacterium]|jgi:ubiquinone biosynthesis protein|nr:2-octaprenylphenol hydroxylase [Moraxellaceae bacterium]MBP9045839.1 2-octaprenylphenol hydroxylase [Moraxellaceae bacterium]MBP9730836.1 2-octaprenylphenol hydroxylase [Moraxellaceae bacterium]HQV42004.1 AarF/UbiB family protein [Moraxellaceae bacterium]HQX90015.1 AarF/UbiB family protein [Moraxellaceae bacterium]